MSETAAHSLTDTYLELRADGSAARIEPTADFWPALMSGQRRIDGRLVVGFRITEDMQHWERHPAGDEVLLLLSGALAVVLQNPAGDQRVALSAGQVFTVPRGRWHRIEVQEPGEAVFMTPGAGTEHKPFVPLD